MQLRLDDDVLKKHLNHNGIVGILHATWQIKIVAFMNFTNI